MLLLFLFVVFASAGALLWFQGLWANAVTLINLLISTVLAFSLTEPITAKLDDSMEAYAYLTDFITVWVLFAVIFSVLRAATDFASRTRVRFLPVVELTGRSILAVLNAYLIVAFAAATLHMAPLGDSPFKGGWPPSVLGLRPDLQFFNFNAALSNGSLNNGQPFNGPDHDRRMRARRGDFEGLEGFTK